MKLAVFLLLAFTLYASPGKANSIHFRGQIKNCAVTSDTRISYIISENPIQYLTNSNWSFCSVKKNGDFEFALPSVKKIAELSLLIYSTAGSVQIMKDGFFVEPGDSVCIFLNYDSLRQIFKVDFSGRGAAKLNCQQALSSIDERAILYFKDDKGKEIRANEDQKLFFGDSVLNLKLQCLEKYRTTLSHTSYEVIKADILGKVFMNTVNDLEANLANLSQEEWVRRLAIFGQVTKLFNKYKPVSEVGFNSLDYLDFLIRKVNLDLLFQLHGKTFQVKDFYQEACKVYSGLVREDVLAYYFCNSLNRRGDYFISTIDPGQYKQCLTDCYSKTTDPYLKEKLFVILRLSKGADVLNFHLQVDSSDRMMSLSDLRGKIVLLDRWAYNCGACVEFTNVFHNKVYPLFKDNPKFAVVSIMSGLSTDRGKYMNRLRNLEDGVAAKFIYTYKDYINLFEAEDKASPSILDYYHSYAAPFILLIDENGKIYSSSVPFFIDSDSPNVQKLIDLIKEALAKNH